MMMNAVVLYILYILCIYYIGPIVCILYYIKAMGGSPKKDKRARQVKTLMDASLVKALVEIPSACKSMIFRKELCGLSDKLD